MGQNGSNLQGRQGGEQDKVGLLGMNINPF